MASITDADTVLVLGLPLILPTPQQIQGFSTDDIFSSAPFSPVHVQMGVDGNLSGGFVPVEKKTEIMLQADSPSNDFFDSWEALQEANLTAYICAGILTYPSLGRTFTMTKGFLTNYSPIASSKKTLQPRRYEITWQTIIGVPITSAG